MATGNVDEITKKYTEWIINSRILRGVDDQGRIDGKTIPKPIILRSATFSMLRRRQKMLENEEKKHDLVHLYTPEKKTRSLRKRARNGDVMKNNHKTILEFLNSSMRSTLYETTHENGLMVRWVGEIEHMIPSLGLHLFLFGDNGAVKLQSHYLPPHCIFQCRWLKYTSKNSKPEMRFNCETFQRLLDLQSNAKKAIAAGDILDDLQDSVESHDFSTFFIECCFDSDDFFSEFRRVSWILEENFERS